MIMLLVMVVVLGAICYVLCKLVSILVGVTFVLASMRFLIRMAKEVFK